MNNQDNNQSQRHPNLKVAVVPINIVAGDKEANIKAVTNLVDKLDSDTDLVILPELFSTGFTADKIKLQRLAEDFSDSPTLSALRQLSGHHNFAIAGSMLGLTDNQVSNRGFFIEPSGEITVYDKRHLFSMSSESHCLTAGQHGYPIVRFRGWNIALVICYDLRFPAWCRNIANSYDLMLVPANWPQSRQYAWSTLLCARAIENQAYYIGANRSGNDKFGNYDNMSLIVDPTGHPIETYGSYSGILCATLDHEKMTHLRTDFAVWRDADSFIFNNNKAF